MEVTLERSETATVWVNPDGTTTAEYAAGPVRYRDDAGHWQPVDPRLKAAADGSVEAKGHPLGLSLSGRAASAPDVAATRRLRASSAVPEAVPLVTVGEGARELILGWRGTLPQPRLEGTKATYVDALPGADLVVESTRTGFEQSVIVKSRAAAGDTGTLRMTLEAKGLRARSAGDGGVEFTDAKGALVGTLPAPVMWDARIDERSGEHLHRAPVGMDVSQQGDTVDLTLTPDAGFLADSATRFPVTIDPSVGLTTTFTTFVQQGYTTDQSTATELKLGNNGSGQVARSFLKFNNRPAKDKVIQSATLKLWNHHSWSCSERAWEVWDTSTPTTASRWTEQPKWNKKWATSTQTKGFGTGCADGWVSADIKTLMQAWSDNANAENSLGIRAADEGDSYGWKRFNSRNAASNIPVIQVTYNTLPAVPTAVTVTPSNVNPANKRRYVTTLTPALAAKVSDADGGTVKAQFEITPDPAFNDAGSYSFTATSAGVSSGGIARVTVPDSKKLPAGSGLRLRVRGHDGTAYGPWSGYTTFRLNTVPPAAPALDCPHFPVDKWSKETGETDCTFTTKSTDGRGFQWGLDNASLPHVVNDPQGTGGRPQTVKINPAKGWHTLYARTVDSGGLLSPTTAYSFGVGRAPENITVPDAPRSLATGATRTLQPILSGAVTTADQDRIRAEFELRDADGKPLVDTALEPSWTESGQRAATQVPQGALVEGRTYRWLMRACSDRGCSDWSPQQTLTATAAEGIDTPVTRSLTLSGSTLEDASAPVAVDGVDCAGSACATERSGQLTVGEKDGKSWVTWLKPDLSQLPAGSRVTGARLHLTGKDCGTDCDKQALVVSELGEPWRPESGGGALAEALEDEPYDDAGTLADQDLAPLVQSWQELGAVDGLAVTVPADGDRTGAVYHSGRAATEADRPRLVIDYLPPVAPDPAEQVRVLPGDQGLIATWNPPLDPGAANPELAYTVVTTEVGRGEAMRTTTKDTRVLVGGLKNDAEYQVTVTAATTHGTGPAATSAKARPKTVPGESPTRYREAVQQYLDARNGILTGVYASVDTALKASSRAPMFEALLTAQGPDLVESREALGRQGNRYTSMASTLSDALATPDTGSGDGVLLRVTHERDAVLQTASENDPVWHPAQQQFAFTLKGGTPVLLTEADDRAVEQRLSPTAAAEAEVDVAVPEEQGPRAFAGTEDSDGYDDDIIDDFPIKLNEDGFPADDNDDAGTGAVPRANVSGSGTANWAKKHVNTKKEYGQDCTNFVSKALYYGGKMKFRNGGRKHDRSWWQQYYLFGTLKNKSYTWSGAENFRRHMIKYRKATHIKSAKQAKPGDLMLFKWKREKRYNHAAVVVANGKQVHLRQHGIENSTTLNAVLARYRNKPNYIEKVVILRPRGRN